MKIGQLRRNDVQGALACYLAGASTPDDVDMLLTLQDNPYELMGLLEKAGARTDHGEHDQADHGNRGGGSATPAPEPEWKKHRVPITPEKDWAVAHFVASSRWWSTPKDMPKMTREESRAKVAELRAKAESIREQTRAGTWAGTGEASGWNTATRIEEEDVRAALRAGYDKDAEIEDATWDDLDMISLPGHIYRGMEEAEIEATVGAGKGVYSENRYSVQDIEGTNFGWEAGTAHSYVNSGSSSALRSGKPNYIVEVKPDETITYNKTAGYPQTPVGQGLDHKQITRLWKFEGRDGKLVLKEVPVPPAYPRQYSEYYSRLKA